MLVLGIETTCDETAIAVVRDGKEILSNTIFSQIDLHRKYGGVFPELASRSHVEKFPVVLQESLRTAGIALQDIDLISVAKGPGLMGPLLIGLNSAKALALALQKPLIGVSHVEAHLYAAMMTPEDPVFPSLGLVVSGGHTFLVLIDGVGSYTKIGSTVDDAVGEAFDKVAKMLDLPYPGGPEIEKIAKEGDPKAYSFAPGRVKGKLYDFSFSGLKTNVFYSVYGQNGVKDTPCPLSHQQKADIAASFQETALQDIVKKTLLAAQDFNCKAIYVGGGVSQSKRLRELLSSHVVFFPPKGLSLDNGAMIAGLGYHRYQEQGHGDSLDLEPHVTRGI